MRVKRLQAENFRLLAGLDLQPVPGINLITGPNAAGKTSLLEAIYALGRGRSFRGSPAEAAGSQGGHWLVRGETSSPGTPARAIGVAWSAEGLRVRVDQADMPVSELVRLLPVQILEPDSHRLLEDGPAHRRRYLDWGVFHVEHQFLPAWRRYHRALRQRNRALKGGSPKAEADAWAPELVSAGELIQTFREHHLEVLRPALDTEIRRLLGAAEWSMELSRGWPADRPLSQAIEEHYEQDRRQAMTVLGPHRAELRLRFAGRSAKHQVSRGQQKLLVAALLLAQARLIAEHVRIAPILLVDDFPAELGPEFQSSFLQVLQDYPGQVFVTAIEPTAALAAIPESAVFHVEHGVCHAAARPSAREEIAQ